MGKLPFENVYIHGVRLERSDMAGALEFVCGRLREEGAGLPLAAPRQHSAAVMLNLLGELWFDGEASVTPPWQRVLALPGTKLHLYGKTAPRRGRKMGHLTIVAADAAAARRVALEAAACLGLPPF